ncbi:hypothetical protein TRFO_33235 [Tritrichomonas foetus]|uniref:Uncharacterized protein n=1 Tax=Tritrichomonas foetus TaxID=1144522 RepID=A0A1J4JP20_9EUKA|nr:hypothetical protein TRFO_33235 [Tritrichomonas foetus]|eukprot:OHT00160.1 hypothetical protein TRFO_33235 [Tritrichomonas foetus]
MTRRNNDSASVNYISQLNFSIFTEKYKNMCGKNRPKDHHGKIRREWIRTIRNAFRASNIQTVITFLYASKSHAIQARRSLEIGFYKWQNRYQKKLQMKEKWREMKDNYVKKQNMYFINDIKKQVHKIRATRASFNMLTNYSVYNQPDFVFFFNQINDNQFEKESVQRIGYRKMESPGKYTTMTQADLSTSSLYSENYTYTSLSEGSLSS